MSKVAQPTVQAEVLGLRSGAPCVGSENPETVAS